MGPDPRPPAPPVFPSYDSLFTDVRSYWSVHQVEWATDVLFETPAALAALYLHLTRHAITQFSSADVMRFLGRKLTGNLHGELVSDYKHRAGGVRVKHRLNGTLLKIYDKHRRILRVETTVHKVRDLKTYRRPEGRPSAALAWRPISSGVANLHRLAEISQAANERYLGALAQLETRTPVRELVDTVCRPTTRNGRRLRALRPWSELDTMMLTAINRGEFALTGFRNRDLRALLFPTSTNSIEQRRRDASRITRLLGLLRAHKVIKKIHKTHRYELTDRGRLIVSTVLAARNAELSTLLKLAA